MPAANRSDRPEPTRRPDEPKLVGAVTAASIIGCRPNNLRGLKDLPDPYDYVDSGTLWRESDIQAFAARRARAHEGAIASYVREAASK